MTRDELIQKTILLYDKNIPIPVDNVGKLASPEWSRFENIVDFYLARERRTLEEIEKPLNTAIERLPLSMRGVRYDGDPYVAIDKALAIIARMKEEK